LATLKTYNGKAAASIKTYNGKAVASVKTINGILFPSLNVQRDGESNSKTVGAGATSLTWSHTVNSQTNSCLFVIVKLTSNTTISTVTFNGDAMTAVGTVTQSTNLRVSIYRRVAPDVGTFNVVVTLAASDEFEASALNTYNVDQATPTGGTSTASGSGVTSSSIAKSSAVGELVLDGIAVGVYPITVGAGQTEVDNESLTAVEVGASTEPGAATTTMSWSWSTASNYAHIATDINKA
jgi:hypothetical protein